MTNRYAYIIGFPDLYLFEAKNFMEKVLNKQKGAEGYAYLRQDVGKITKMEDNYVYYRCRTLTGQSGGPIFVMSSNINKKG